MRIIEIESKNIKIVYKPAEDNLAIGDFVDISEGSTTLIAQVFKLYSDDNSSEYNYADVSIFLTQKYGKTAAWNGEVVSAEAKVSKTPWEFIEKYINNSDFSEVFAFGYCSGTYNQPLKFNFKNFLTPAFVGYEDFSDNISFLKTVAYQMQKHGKKLLVIDYNGNIELDGAKRVTAGFELKLPLNAKAMEKLSSKMTEGVSVESRAIIEEVLVDLAEFSRETGDFISITRLVDVINETYKKTKIAQLVLLKNKLRTYQRQNIFADLINETELLDEALALNNVVIFDISNLQKEWQNEFLNYAIRANKQPENGFFLYLNIEPSLDNNLLRYLLFKSAKNGVKPILGANYRHVAADTVLDFCPNSFLFRTSNNLEKREYLSDILKSLAKDYFVVTGKLTSSLILTSYLGEPVDILDEKTILEQNIETNETLDIIQEKLNNEAQTAPEPITNVDMDAINTAISFSEEKPEIKLAELQNNTEESAINVPNEPIISEEPLPKATEELSEISDEEPLQTGEPEQIVELVPEEVSESQNIEPESELQPIEETLPVEEPIEKVEESQQTEEPEQIVELLPEEVSEPQNIEPENELKPIEETLPVEEAQSAEENEQVVDFVPDETLEPQNLDESDVELEEIQIVDEEQTIEFDPEEVELQQDTNNSTDDILEGADILDDEFGEQEEVVEEINDDDLDFLNDLSDEQQNYSQNDDDELLDLLGDDEETPDSENINIDDIDFDEEISAQPAVDENIEEQVSEPATKKVKQKQKLPVYDANYEKKPKPKNTLDLQEGDLVKHNKYGLGTVKKLMNHGNKIMCSINFEDFGRRLLDPEISQLEKIK